MDAVEALLAAHLPPGTILTRAAGEPTGIPADGWVDIGHGTPAEVGAIIGGAKTRDWRLDIPLVVQTQAPDAATRNAVFAVLVAAIGAALSADRTLGAACDWAETGSVEDGADIDIDGGATIRAGTITLSAWYMTGDNSLEAV